MLPINRKLQLIGICLACSLVVAVAANLLFGPGFPRVWGFAKSLDLYFYNLFFSSSLEPSPDLVVIDSDDPTKDRSRSDYAMMIRQLGQAGAKCIALDINFVGENEEDPIGDQELVNSVRDYPQVVLAIDFSSGGAPDPMIIAELEKRALPDTVCNELVPRLVADIVELPFKTLLSAATHVGHANFASGEPHHFPPVIDFDRKCYASLPVEMARIYFESAGRSFPVDSIPLDREGQMLVNFIPEENFPSRCRYNWDQAIQAVQSSPESFRDAMVLIVNPSAESSVLPAPRLVGPLPRWSILASLTSQLLQGRHIDTSVLYCPLGYSILIGLLGLGFFLFVAPRLEKKWRKMRMLILGGSALFLLLIVLLLRWWHLWLGVVIPLLIYNVTLLVVRHIYYRMIGRPQYLEDFEVAVLERRGEIYPVKIVKSPVGEEESDLSFNSFLEEKDFLEALDRLKKLTASESDAKKIGEKLFDAVFQGEAFHALKNSLERGLLQKRNLRLKLHLDPPELVCLPWELMHSQRLKPGRLVLRKRLSLVRYLPMPQSFAKPESSLPLKILVVIPQPTDLPPENALDIDGEMQLIKQSLRPLIWGGDVRLKFCTNATVDNLRMALDNERPEVLHYSGHGSFDAKLNEAFLEFESENKTSSSVSAEVLGHLLSESSVKLVVLNSCEGAMASNTDAFTGMAQNLVRVGVPAVVAMQFKIRDETSKYFAWAFYSKILNNYSIDAAVAEARQYIMAKTNMREYDWAAPVLFMREQSGLIFDVKESR